MAAYSRKNLYPGVNPHLQSFLQNGGNWEGFHQGFIISLQEVIESQLPDNYYADVQQSLQIRSQTKPDILISRRPSEKPTPQLSSGKSTALLFPEETIEIEEVTDYYPALIIYQREPTSDIPVTRIEVLSPANKPPQGSHYKQYDRKRRETLLAMVLANLSKRQIAQSGFFAWWSVGLR